MGKSKTMSKKSVEAIEVLDEMLTALVGLLEEKGIITWDEWEERIKKRNTDVIEETSIEGFRLSLERKDW